MARPPDRTRTRTGPTDPLAPGDGPQTPPAHCDTHTAPPHRLSGPLLPLTRTQRRDRQAGIERGGGAKRTTPDEGKPFSPCSAHMGTYMADAPCIKSLWGTSRPTAHRHKIFFVHGRWGTSGATVSLCTVGQTLCRGGISLHLNTLSNSCTSHSTDYLQTLQREHPILTRAHASALRVVVVMVACQ